MPSTLQMVEKFEELLQRKTNDSPYDYQTLFPTGGFFVRRASQRKLKFLKQIDEKLRAMLKPDERVWFLTRGTLYSFWESYFVGALIYYLNLRAMVVTNERLILIHVDTKNRPKALRAQIPLRNIDRFRKTIFGNVVARLKSDKSFTFAYVPRRDRQPLVEILEGQQAGATTQSTAPGIENLCPFCYVPQEGLPERCAKCGGEFKSAAKAGWLSLFVPGLGSVYIGQWAIGLVKMLVALIVWANVFLPDPKNPSVEPIAYAIAAAFVLLFIHVPSALISRALAKKGLYPAGEPPAHAHAAARH